ncbi:MAG: signal peptide peptidase SppA [Bacteroidia bacterium]
MKSFFGSLLGALVGVIFTGIIAIFAIGGMVSSAFKSDKEPYALKPASILHLKLDAPLVDRHNEEGFSGLAAFRGEKKNTGLDYIIKQLKKAEKDTRIKGVFLEGANVQAGMATTEELRNAMLDFKKSGKFIYSYGETYSQKGYYLSSVSDKIFIHPEGGLDFKGLSAQVMFYKKMLEKLDIHVQIFRHGKFKSAVEPFDLEKMSAPNREQTMTYVGSLWNQMLKGIGSTRKINAATLNELATNLKIRSTQNAVDNRLVDAKAYYDEVTDELRKKASPEATEKLHLVSLEQFSRAAMEEDEADDDKLTRDKIAVIYAIGSIESGEGDDETIGSDRIAKAIRDAREDENVKAIVLRVNSPGGSALASDVIWREMTLAKKAKPVIVSMGDVAASGGYYIACNAHLIVAQPNTITGSIGVFGLLPEMQSLLTNQVGVTIDTVNTNPHADLGTLFRPLHPLEAEVMQQGVEDVYETFIGRVADGRKMSKADVDSIGQGRVWSGTDALRIGLVDTLGGLDVAIAAAAKQAKLGTNYRIKTLPVQKNPFDDFLKKASDDAKEEAIKGELGLLRTQYDQFRRSQALLQAKGVQARLPFDLIIY